MARWRKRCRRGTGRRIGAVTFDETETMARTFIIVGREDTCGISTHLVFMCASVF
jgi:hypothetical protein